MPFRGFLRYTSPKIVALTGASTASPLRMRLSPRHRLDEVPSLSSFQRPPGSQMCCSCSVGL